MVLQIVFSVRINLEKPASQNACAFKNLNRLTNSKFFIAAMKFVSVTNSEEGEGIEKLMSDKLFSGLLSLSESSRPAAL